ncbi:hypothetical protein TIFTF001_013930 [Ficus carica]|uniref:Uncharacterized protein n=1 Tax=Ficus carica TaxID=3494 RepID=A0AA87ZYM5_FICCA|nr:hypothetical protein TIFTF001_013930 [Ficus carica]
MARQRRTQETERLREQLAQLNRRPRADEVPPQDNRVPPIVPPVPDVQPEVQPEAPRNAEVPIAPAGGEILAAQQDEFTNFKQGSMTVMEAVKKFEQLARLCPELVPS